MSDQISSWSKYGAQAAPPAAPPSPVPGDPSGFSPRPAGFWIRFLAQLVDGLVLFVGEVVVLGLFAGAGFLMGVFRDEPGPVFFVLFGLLYVSLIVGMWLYFALTESSASQATLGKRALGLVVSDPEGRRISFGRATGRFFAKILSGLPINLGYVIAAFTERKRALHDYVAGTVVERRRPVGAGGIVAAIAAGVLPFIAILGILAAIAVPNFVKFQLRSKETEASAQLLALAEAQGRRLEQGEPYVELSLPAEGTPGPARLAWSPDDQQVAAELGWEAPAATHFSYRVVVEEDADGHQAYSACAEADLDGDGTHSAWAVFQPFADEGEVVLEAPEAPCAREPALERPPTREEDDPVGVPIRLSPRDVF